MLLFLYTLHVSTRRNTVQNRPAAGHTDLSQNQLIQFITLHGGNDTALQGLPARPDMIDIILAMFILETRVTTILPLGSAIPDIVNYRYR